MPDDMQEYEDAIAGVNLCCNLAEMAMNHDDEIEEDEATLC
jgi:hypothetical protein